MKTARTREQWRYQALVCVHGSEQQALGQRWIRGGLGHGGDHFLFYDDSMLPAANAPPAFMVRSMSSRTSRALCPLMEARATKTIHSDSLCQRGARERAVSRRKRRGRLRLTALPTLRLA